MKISRGNFMKNVHLFEFWKHPRMFPWRWYLTKSGFPFHLRGDETNELIDGLGHKYSAHVNAWFSSSGISKVQGQVKMWRNSMHQLPDKCSWMCTFCSQTIGIMAADLGSVGQPGPHSEERENGPAHTCTLVHTHRHTHACKSRPGVWVPYHTRQSVLWISSASVPACLDPKNVLFPR